MTEISASSTSKCKYLGSWQILKDHRETSYGEGRTRRHHTGFASFVFASEDINAVKAHWWLTCTQSRPVAWMLYRTACAHCATQTPYCVKASSVWDRRVAAGKSAADLDTNGEADCSGVRCATVDTPKGRLTKHHTFPRNEKLEQHIPCSKQWLPTFFARDLVKDNATNFTHQSVFTALGEENCICGRSCTKHFLAG